MSQPIALQIREMLDTGSPTGVRTPPRDALVATLINNGFAAHISDHDLRSVLIGAIDVNSAGFTVIADEIRLVPGGAVWRDGKLDDAIISTIAFWLDDYFEDHEVWLVNGSGSIAFKVNAETLANQLQRRAAGETVRDANPPSNI